ncbi:unnamed protein product, partial [Rotaria sp. Silwood2]
MSTFGKNQFKKIIKSINRYSITVDFWTEPHIGVSFGGVSIHCYFKTHGLKSMVLSFHEYDLPNSKSPNIRAFTEDILSDFDLTINENVYIMRNNELKMKAAFREGVKRTRCSAHYVNKIIEHSLTNCNIGCDLIQQTFNQVKIIVTHIRQTHIQAKLSLSINLFSKTRWNSTFQMIQDFLEIICPQLKDEFYNVLKEELDKRQSLESKTHKPCPKLTASLITPKRIRTNLLSDCYDLGPSVDAISNDETEIE